MPHPAPQDRAARLGRRAAATLMLALGTLSLSGPALAASERVKLSTSLGDIVVELDRAKAPKTVANFLQYVKDGHYAGTVFHRVIDGFMIQGGDPTGTGRGGPGYRFADEFHPELDAAQGAAGESKAPRSPPRTPASPPAGAATPS